MESAVEHAELSDVGMRRSNNQDSYAVSVASNHEEWEKWGHLFLVADGMGAHAAGELASQIAADQVPHLYHKHKGVSPPEALRQAVLETNAEINRKGQANEEFHKMGTTCSVLTLLPQGAVIAHVGDSRVYRYRNNRLEQLTFDHSLVWETRQLSQLGPDSEMAMMVPRNVITRSLGPNADVNVDLEGPFPTQVGDTFLLCSDGLVGEVADDEIGPILAHLPPKEAARALVDLANLRGGSDNVTVLVARIVNPTIASESTASAPLTVNARQRKSNPGITALIGSLSGAMLLAGLVLFVIQNPVPALLAAVIGLGLFGIFAIRFWGSSPGGTVISSGRRFGKGPYTQTECVAVKGLYKKLTGIIDDLREAAIEQDWSIEWQSLQRFIDSAEAAAQKGEYNRSLQESIRAISFSLEQLRRQRK